MDSRILKLWRAAEDYSIQFENTHWVEGINKRNEDLPEVQLYRLCGRIIELCEDMDNQEHTDPLLADLALENNECY